MMSDERFYADVKAVMGNYSPEVPGSVYEGMRRKLWWSRFTKLSATRFNMWYLILLVGAGSAATINYFGNSSDASRSAAFMPNSFEISAPVIESASVTSSPTSGELKTSTTSKSSCCSSFAKSNSCSVNSAQAEMNGNAEGSPTLESAVDPIITKETVIAVDAEASVNVVDSGNPENTAKEQEIQPEEKKLKGLPITVLKDKNRK